MLFRSALKFYSSVRLDIRRIGAVKEGTEVIGSRVRTKVVKNKIAPPFRDTELDLLYDRGISYEGDLVDLASDMDIIQRSGAWYNYGDLKLGQGKEKARQFLMENPKLTEEVKAKIFEAKGLDMPEKKSRKSG